MSSEEVRRSTLSVTFDGRTRPGAELMEQVYDELRALAGSYLRSERPGHTLQATALVHEAYARISQARVGEWESSAHFFAYAAETIRRILVDYARRRKTQKRGGGKRRIELTPLIAASEEGAGVDVLDLNEALEELSREDAQAAKTVEYRYFGGLKTAEIAALMNVSPRTVDNHWAYGRAWLYKRLKAGAAG